MQDITSLRGESGEESNQVVLVILFYESMVREKIIIALLLFIIICLVIGKITATDFLDQFDQSNYDIEQQIRSLDTQNNLLEIKLLHLESYTEIASEAARMGYH